MSQTSNWIEYDQEWPPEGVDIMIKLDDGQIFEANLDAVFAYWRGGCTRVENIHEWAHIKKP